MEQIARKLFVRIAFRIKHVLSATVLLKIAQITAVCILNVMIVLILHYIIKQRTNQIRPHLMVNL